MDCDAGDRPQARRGALVVDATPSSNTQYIQAILGKDLTAKKDDAIKKAGLEKKKEPPRRRFFSFFRRSASTSDDKPEKTSDKKAEDADGAGN